MVQDQPVRDPGAAVVTDELERPEAEPAHGGEPEGPLGLKGRCAYRADASR
jgi:hypothetical protein